MKTPKHPRELSDAEASAVVDDFDAHRTASSPKQMLCQSSAPAQRRGERPTAGSKPQPCKLTATGHPGVSLAHSSA